MITFFCSLSHRQRLAAMVYGLMVLGLMMMAAQPTHPHRPQPTFADAPMSPPAVSLAAN